MPVSEAKYPPKECDVVVIGAGLSGLTAAYRLSKVPKVKVVVIEAKDRVGGRTLSLPAKNAHGQEELFDLGGTWVGNTQPHILGLLKELGIGTYEQYATGKKVMQLGDDRIRTYSTDIPNLSWLGVVDLGLFLYKVDRMSAAVDPKCPYDAKRAAELDAETVESFTRRTAWTQEVRDIVDPICRVVFGVEACHMSLLYFLSYVRAGGDIRTVSEVKGDAAQRYKIEGGSQSVSKRLMVLLGSDKVYLETPVESIAYDSGGVTVTYRNGSHTRCKTCITTIPPNLLRNVTFEPRLSTDHSLLLQLANPGHLTKYLFTYEKTFWREAGYSGEVVSSGNREYAPELGAPLLQNPVAVVYDSTTQAGCPALIVFMGGRQSTQWYNTNITKEQRRAAVLKDLVSFFGPDAERYCDCVEKDWNQEPYSGGCPTIVFGSGAMPYYKRLRAPLGNDWQVIPAGTEAATVWCGYMDGAVQSGHRAAVHAIRKLRPEEALTESDETILKEFNEQNGGQSSSDIAPRVWHGFRDEKMSSGFFSRFITPLVFPVVLFGLSFLSAYFLFEMIPQRK